MKKGITVYYAISGSDRIEKDIAVRQQGTRIIFSDGGWNHASDCYFTRHQCERANGIPSRRVKHALDRAKKSMGRAQDAIGHALSQLSIEAD